MAGREVREEILHRFLCVTTETKPGPFAIIAFDFVIEVEVVAFFDFSDYKSLGVCVLFRLCVLFHARLLVPLLAARHRVDIRLTRRRIERGDPLVRAPRAVRPS